MLNTDLNSCPYSHKYVIVIVLYAGFRLTLLLDTSYTSHNRMLSAMKFPWITYPPAPEYVFLTILRSWISSKIFFLSLLQDLESPTHPKIAPNPAVSENQRLSGKVIAHCTHAASILLTFWPISLQSYFLIHWTVRGKNQLVRMNFYWTKGRIELEHPCYL